MQENRIYISSVQSFRASFCTDILVDYLGDILQQRQTPAGCLLTDLGLGLVARGG